MRELMGKLKLTVNEDKTRICTVPEGSFEFLGYTFGRLDSAKTGQARMGMRPSKKSIRRWRSSLLFAGNSLTGCELHGGCRALSKLLVELRS